LDILIDGGNGEERTVGVSCLSRVAVYYALKPSTLKQVYKRKM